MSATATPPARAPLKPAAKLRAAQARSLVQAQTRYDRAKRELDEARTARDAILAKLLPKFELGRWVTIAGWALRVTMQSGGQRFRLSEYLKKHKLTASMKPYVTEPTEHPRLWIKPNEAKGA